VRFVFGPCLAAGCLPHLSEYSKARAEVPGVFLSARISRLLKVVRKVSPVRLACLSFQHQWLAWSVHMLGPGDLWAWN
jgi:hypothetical protein